MSAPCPYPPTPSIAVDVDGTLVVNGALNRDLVAFCQAQKAKGLSLLLWSARGKAYALAVAQHFAVETLFDDIVSKPGYIVDDQGWNWIKYTRVIRGPRDVPGVAVPTNPQPDPRP